MPRAGSICRRPTGTRIGTLGQGVDRLGLPPVPARHHGDEEEAAGARPHARGGRIARGSTRWPSRTAGPTAASIRRAITGTPARTPPRNCCACWTSAPPRSPASAPAGHQAGPADGAAGRRAGPALSAAPLPDGGGGEADRRAGLPLRAARRRPDGRPPWCPARTSAGPCGRCWPRCRRRRLRCPRTCCGCCRRVRPNTGRIRDSFSGRTGLTFDPLGAAEGSGDAHICFVVQSAPCRPAGGISPARRFSAGAARGVAGGACRHLARAGRGPASPRRPSWWWSTWRCATCWRWPPPSGILALACAPSRWRRSRACGPGSRASRRDPGRPADPRPPRRGARDDRRLRPRPRDVPPTPHARPAAGRGRSDRHDRPGNPGGAAYMPQSVGGTDAQPYKMTMAVMVGNRGFFPDHLAKTGREPR